MSLGVVTGEDPQVQEVIYLADLDYFRKALAIVRKVFTYETNQHLFK